MLLIRPTQLDAFGPNAVQRCVAEHPATCHWIEFELLGEDGEPLPEEPYRLSLPEGGEVDGCLNRQGVSRLVKIPTAGRCRLMFPKRGAECHLQVLRSCPAGESASDLPLPDRNRARLYTLQLGETLGDIAKRTGLEVQAIWNAPQNAHLRHTFGQVEQLRCGARVAIPLPGSAAVLDTDRHHILRVVSDDGSSEEESGFVSGDESDSDDSEPFNSLRGDRSSDELGEDNSVPTRMDAATANRSNAPAIVPTEKKIRLQMLVNGQAYAEIEYSVQIDCDSNQATIKGRTSPGGVVECTVPATTQRGRLFIGEETILLQRAYDPMSIEQRLSNLGANGGTQPELQRASFRLRHERAEYENDAQTDAAICTAHDAVRPVAADAAAREAHRIGMSQADWEELRTGLAAWKRTQPIYFRLFDQDEKVAVDTSDVELEIDLEIIHLDVDQGESTLLMLTCERDHLLMSMVIDGGRTVPGGGLLARLDSLGLSRVDAVIISHLDIDHIEGLVRLLSPRAGEGEDLDEEESLDLGSQSLEGSEIDPVIPRSTVFLRDLPVDDTTEAVVNLKAALSFHMQEIVVDGLEIILDCNADRGLFSMKCLNGDTPRSENENINSLAWLLRFGKHTYYTAGDLPAKEEDDLLQSLPPHLTAIKCGHHGSKTSTSAKFLSTAKPALAFISSGKQDGYRHPDVATLINLQQAASVHAVFITACCYHRPFVFSDDEYKCAAQKEIFDLLKQVVELLNTWIGGIEIKLNLVSDDKIKICFERAILDLREHMVPIKGKRSPVDAAITFKKNFSAWRTKNYSHLFPIKEISLKNRARASTLDQSAALRRTKRQSTRGWRPRELPQELDGLIESAAGIATELVSALDAFTRPIATTEMIVARNELSLGNVFLLLRLAGC